MAIAIETIGRKTQTREIRFTGSPGSQFELHVKEGSNFYNWDTDNFQTKEKILKKQEIPSNGIYTKKIVIPTVTANKSYDFFVRPLPGTVSKLDATHTQKIGVLYQKADSTMTFATTSSSLTIAAALTGGTITAPGTLTQTGAITKADGAILYVHTTPTWNASDGGNWAGNTAYVTATVVNVTGANVVLSSGTGVTSGFVVKGENIVDEITVSAISGVNLTLSAAQNLQIGDTLVFSKEGWKVSGITGEMSLSGTTSITMSVEATIETAGRGDLTSTCSVDSFVSIKPNAFPVNEVFCPTGGSVVIKPHLVSTNYLGTLGDNDANQSSKEYAIHSVPSAATSSRAILFEEEIAEGDVTPEMVVGSSSVSAGASMGSTGEGAVTYTAAELQEPGDTDHFYYKISNLGVSSLTQGKISITIV